MQLGADAEALDRLAVSLARAAAGLRRSVRSLDGSVRAVAWSGADARRFTEQWRSSSAGCGRTAAVLDAAASAVRAQAAEQRRASRPDDIGGARSLAVGVMEAAPYRIRVATLAADVSLGPLTVGASEQLRLEDLADGRVRVTATSGETVGAQAGRGVSFDLEADGRRVGGGSSAQAAAMAGTAAGVTWVVRRDEVGELLAAHAAELAVGSRLAPPPVAARRSVGLDVAAEAAAGAAAARGVAAAGAAGALSVSRGPASTTFAVEGSVAASLAAGLGSRPLVDRGIDASAEAAFTVADDGSPLRLDVGSSWVEPGRGGDVLVRRRVAVDLTAPEVRSSAGALKRALERGPTGRHVRRSVEQLIAAASGATSVAEDRYRLAPPLTAGLSTPLASVTLQIDEFRLVPDGG